MSSAVESQGRVCERNTGTLSSEFMKIENHINFLLIFKGGPLMVWNASFMKSKEICQVIADLQVSKVALSLEDIELILDTLVYDGKVEKSVGHEAGEQVKMYRAIETLLPSAGFVRVPCGICPVRSILISRE